MTTLACNALDVTAGGHLLVDGLTLAIAPGEMVFMLGVNGSGKTTALHTLAGLTEAASGTIELLSLIHI